MSGGYHFPGHRVGNISFSQRWVECDCGVRLTVEETPFLEMTRAALAAAFSLHRKQAAQKVRCQ